MLKTHQTAHGIHSVLLITLNLELIVQSLLHGATVPEQLWAVLASVLCLLMRTIRWVFDDNLGTIFYISP